MTRQRAILLLTLTALLWSLGGIFIKSIHWNPLAIAGIRSAVAACFLFACTKKFKFTWSKLQWSTAIAYVATVILFVSATKLTTAANAILLQYTAPIYVAIFSYWYLKETVTRFDWLTIVIVICGMTIFFVDNLSTENFLGNILAIASGISFAWLTLFLRRQKGISTTESIFLGNILTFLITLPFMFQAPLNATGWYLLIAMGIIQLALPYFLYAKAIIHVTALEAILVPVIEPVLNPIWVFLINGEEPSKAAFIGGTIVIGAVTANAIYKSKKKKS
ncbi:MAG: EamA family transporter [Oligoflexia bacterium]|nr:EamA family transporter [Oligoflexia bacterium]